MSQQAHMEALRCPAAVRWLARCADRPPKH